jgi:hypothetical protein
MLLLETKAEHPPNPYISSWGKQEKTSWLVVDKDRRNICPTLLPTALPHTVALRPVGDFEVFCPHWHPHALARISFRLRDEPAGLVWRLTPLFASFPGRALELFLLDLEVVRTFVSTELKRALVWTDATVGWTEKGTELVWTVVQRDGERREIEGCLRLNGVAPEENELGRRCGDVRIQRAFAGAHGTSHELRVPAASDIIGEVASRVHDFTGDFERIFTPPSTRFECQSTLVAGAVIRHLMNVRG